mmetsp:Transcript_17756/g.17087  ORF Transcript_17756/g.17087 Transcript_17756/m.17087 type:complete len:101 (-) Transcript_17756:21-323(-)
MPIRTPHTHTRPLIPNTPRIPLTPTPTTLAIPTTIRMCTPLNTATPLPIRTTIPTTRTPLLVKVQYTNHRRWTLIFDSQWQCQGLHPLATTPISTLTLTD